MQFKHWALLAFLFFTLSNYVITGLHLEEIRLQVKALQGIERAILRVDLSPEELSLGHVDGGKVQSYPPAECYCLEDYCFTSRGNEQWRLEP